MELRCPQRAVPTYTGFSGNFFNGEDINEGTRTNPLSLTWDNIDISTLPSLLFSGLFAAQSPANGGDFNWGLTGDFVRVSYRINANSGDFTNLLWFSGTNTTNDDPLVVDNNFDGLGDGTALSETAASFSRVIPGTGSTLDLRIHMSSNAATEAFAFDTLQIMRYRNPPRSCSAAWSAVR